MLWSLRLWGTLEIMATEARIQVFEGRRQLEMLKHKGFAVTIIIAISSKFNYSQGLSAFALFTQNYDLNGLTLRYYDLNSFLQWSGHNSSGHFAFCVRNATPAIQRHPQRYTSSFLVQWSWSQPQLSSQRCLNASLASLMFFEGHWCLIAPLSRKTPITQGRRHWMTMEINYLMTCMITSINYGYR